MRLFVRFILFGTIFTMMFSPIIAKIFAYGKKVYSHKHVVADKSEDKT
jgi:uncharacterized membrane protein